MAQTDRAAIFADAKRGALREGMRKWGRDRRSLDSRRDGLVLASLDAGITKEEIHQAMGLGRTTIDRIEKTAANA